MTEMMGVENMGGPAVGFLPALPTPTVERGAVMAGMDHANMPGMRMKDSTRAGQGQMKMPGDKDSSKVAAMDHDKMQMPGMRKDSMLMRTRADSIAGMDHNKMPGMTRDSTTGGMDASGDQMMQLHMRMMADSVIRRRMMADTAMRRLMEEMMQQMPPEQRAHMESMMHSQPSAATADAPHGHEAMAAPTPGTASSKKKSANAGSVKPKTTTGKSPTKGAKKDSTSKMPGMSHSKMPGMTAAHDSTHH